MECPKCGMEIEDGSTICSNCGNNLKDKSKKLKIIVIVILILIIISLLIIILLTNKNDKKDTKVTNLNNSVTETEEETKNSESEENNKTSKKEVENLISGSKVDTDNLVINPEKSSDLNDNIELIKAMYSADNKYIYLLLKNNNSEAVEFKLQLDYYDDENYRIESDTCNFAKPNANKEFICELSSYGHEDLVYSGYKVTYNANKIQSWYKIYDADKIEIKSSVKEEYGSSKIKVNVTNNNSEEVKTIYITCIYYKNNEIVYLKETTVSNLDPGFTESIEISNLKDYNTGEMIDYDDYRLVVSSAYTYTGEY